MKRLLSAFLLTLSLATQAGLPPTSSKLSGESVYSTTFKTDFGTFKGTRSGTTLTLNSIGAASGDSLALGGSINANAVLDVQSTTKAFMPPRMTTTQKQAIPTPTEGMFVHDNVIKMPSWYDGTNWQNGLGTITVDTDPANYSPTLSAGFGTTSNTNICKYWRTGSFLNASCYATIAGITTGIGSIGLPTGLTIDSAKLTANNTTSAEGQIVGLFGQRATSGNGYIVTATGTSTSVVYVAYAYDSNPNKLIPSSVDMNAVFTNGLTSFNFKVPIVGWASNGSTYSASNSNYDWTSYSPSLSAAWGTIASPSSNYCKHKRVGGTLTVSCAFTAGTVQPVVGSIPLPGSLQIDSSRIVASNTTAAAGQKVGSYGTNTASANGAIVTATGTSLTSVYIGSTNNNSAYLVPTVVNAIIGNNALVSIEFSVPILGWSEASQVVAIVPSPAIISDVKTNGTNGGTCTSGSFLTRDLNTLVDPSTIVSSLSSNQFTLPAGKYLIEATAPAYLSDRNRLKLRNITDSTDDILGQNSFAETAGGDGYSVNLSGIVTISTSKTFELQQRCSVTKASTGFGIASSFSISEVYSVVKITRL